MSRYIAFLRAINVGGHNVKMSQLIQLFESLGLKNVESFIASGNLVFDAKAGNVKTLEKKIETKLHEALGYEVATFIRTNAELDEISKHKPFPQVQLDTATALNIAFIANPIDDQAKQKLMALQNEIDAFHVHGREIYWMCQKKQSESKFSNAILEKAIGAKATLRSINTVRKMAEKYT
ncbi:MAG: DUF1697 domain-containing protein [Anaerolineales bacterium]|nr:DUF1697 domain-containing protein [Anaerolineales bacterium]